MHSDSPRLAFDLRCYTCSLIELDDQNFDSRWMKNSKIESRQIIVDSDAGFAVLDLFEEFAGKSFVLDIGNQTAEAALAAMGRNGLLGRFNLILVPVKDVGQDVENAKRTINKIREDEPSAKIVLVLNSTGLAAKPKIPKTVASELCTVTFSTSANISMYLSSSCPASRDTLAQMVSTNRQTRPKIR